MISKYPILSKIGSIMACLCRLVSKDAYVVLDTYQQCYISVGKIKATRHYNWKWLPSKHDGSPFYVAYRIGCWWIHFPISNVEETHK